MNDILLAIRTRLLSLRLRRDDDRGASLIEYALLIGLITVVCFVAVQFLGEETSGRLESTGSSFANP